MAHAWTLVWAFCAPLLYLSLLTGTLIYVFKKRFNFQVLLPVALVSATLFVYFLTFATHRISIGIIITAVAAFAFIFLLIRDSKRAELLKTLFFTPGFLLFFVLYTGLFFLHYNSVVEVFSDDTMHWAPHVWTMWMRDDFYTSPGLSIVTHGDYPPILQLFQLIFSRIAGTYREGLLYVALELTSFSMLFPLLKNLVWKKGKVRNTLILSALILISFVVLPTTLDVTHLFYNALHPDYAIAFVFVACIVFAVRGSRPFTWHSAVMLSLVATFLGLTKQSSILFVGLAGIIYAACLWHSYGLTMRQVRHHLKVYLSRRRTAWPKIAAAVVLIALPYGALKLWQLQIRGFQAPYCCVAIFHVSPSDALKVPDVLLGKTGDVSQQNYAHNFFRYILTYQAGFTTQLLTGVTYVQFTLLFIGAAIYIGYKYKDKFRRSRLAIVMTILVAGWFIYGFAIYLTFLFGGMIDSERDNLLVGDRYLRTYVFAMLLVLFALLITYIITAYNQKRTANKSLLRFSVIIIVVVGLLFNIDLIKNGMVFENHKYLSEYSAQGISNPSEIASKMRTFSMSLGGTYKSPKKIAVTELAGRDTIYLLRYLTIPNKINNGSDLMLNDSASQEKTCTTLKQNDFLFIEYAYTDSHALSLINGCITNKIDSLKQYDAYKIQKNGDSLSLVGWRY